MIQVILQHIPGLTTDARLKKAGEHGLRLPAPPFAPLTRNVTPQVRMTETANNGTFAWPTGPALREVTFSSILPEPQQTRGPSGFIMPSWAHQPNAKYDYEEPSWWSSLLMTLAREGVIFNLFITYSNATPRATDDSVHTNHPAVIRSYSDWEDEGDARYYNIAFIEFRKLIIKKVKKKKPKGKKPRRPGRGGKKPKPRTANTGRTTNPSKPGSARRA